MCDLSRRTVRIIQRRDGPRAGSPGQRLQPADPLAGQAGIAAPEMTSQ